MINKIWLLVPFLGRLGREFLSLANEWLFSWTSDSLSSENKTDQVLTLYLWALFILMYLIREANVLSEVFCILEIFLVLTVPIKKYICLCKIKKTKHLSIFSCNFIQTFPKKNFLIGYFLCSGAGSDGVEEIKRHPFFSTVDWNVSTKLSEWWTSSNFCMCYSLLIPIRIWIRCSTADLHSVFYCNLAWHLEL